jgi:hypothetical protein
MRVDVSTELDCPADKAWEAVRTSALFLHVAWPVATIADAAELPPAWTQGETVRCRPLVFGFIPVGIRTLHFERIDDTRREIETREEDALVRLWHHQISIAPRPGNRARYRDEIDIDAGLLTPVVWAWANVFYRHRQRRWRALAKTLR